jgi:RNA polymerase sigma-70 factor (ECF subfamily)
MKNHYEVPYDDHLEEYTLPDKSNSYDELDKISLIEAIDNLDEKYREPFIMKYVKGFSLEEISDMLGITVNLVKQRLFRAKKILYESLMED